MDKLRTIYIALFTFLCIAIITFLTSSKSPPYFNGSVSSQPSTEDPSSAFKLDLSDDYDYCQAKYPTVAQYSPLENAELRYVQLINRHGDRTPLDLFPFQNSNWNCSDISEDSFTNIPQSDLDLPVRQQYFIPEGSPYKQKFWKGTCSTGQLTSIGALQLFNLGKSLRELYVDHLEFLPASLNSTDILKVRCSSIWRTRQSAQKLLEGLYPTKYRLAGDSIDILTAPREIETLYGNQIACPKISTIDSMIKESIPYRNYIQANKSYLDKINELLEATDNSSYRNTFYPQADTLLANHCHDQPVCSQSNCVDSNLFDIVVRSANFENHYITRFADSAPENIKVNVGGFLREFKSDLLAALDGHSPKFQIYSAHDSTLMFFLASLAMSDMRMPPYASNLIIESWQLENQKIVVRFIYNDRLLSLPWCDSTVCELDELIKQIELSELINADIECH